MNEKRPKTTDGLMRHIRDNKGIQINGSKQKRELRNIGYFHGYKGYSFFQNKNNKLNFKNFSEINALYEFDSDIKTLFYKHIMFAETAIKNRILEIIHRESGIELEKVFDNILTDYKKYKTGSSDYAKKFKNTMRLRSDIYEKIHSNFKSKPFINHFIYNDRPVPLYAVFELYTLGNLVFFIRCMNSTFKIKIAKDLGLYLDSFRKKEDIVAQLVDCLKGLRNAIAHNGVLYDCRFKDSNVGKQLTEYFNIKMHIKNLLFDRIVDYLAVIILISASLGYSKTELRKVVKTFETNLNELRQKLNVSTYDKVIGTDVLIKLKQIHQYINNLT
ncbi:Abi family protein [Staphylococcus pettenkoferi]|uniref:Abi family protein n=1 Tax=Staphylococcus pettenkoferi TaxID=170573 RepID=UPI0022751BBE|nr:Abi family protein [Staphylococcus pettenkoferi]MCY1580864.1 Abi family protein [Staphylococcus pettenkoferi]